ncbi:hypothetical protein FocnCong_v021395 [Fusarium oxysporum f. sp. conglutinans]|nr:hypothetical protein FocnCong_v021395 [Fusarium oxysporum f. sp. conglutinans]
MRAQARAKSSYFVKQHHQRRGPITRDDLLEAFQNPESADAQQLLNSINRQTAQLRGTRPYWYRKRRELESYAYNLDSPGAFITFTPADLHWRSLYQHLPQFQDWQELPEQQRMGMSSKLLRDNHILQPGTSTGGLAYSEISFSSRNSTSLIIGTGMNGRVVEVAIAMAYSGWTVRLVLTWK